MNSDFSLRLERIAWPIVFLESAGVSYLVWVLRSPEPLTATWIIGSAAAVLGVISIAFIVDTWFLKGGRL